MMYGCNNTFFFSSLCGQQIIMLAYISILYYIFHFFHPNGGLNQEPSASKLISRLTGLKSSDSTFLDSALSLTSDTTVM